jgi:hypothetical protein
MHMQPRRTRLVSEKTSEQFVNLLQGAMRLKRT